MKQITKSIYQISLGAVNAFIIEDNGLTLVDTGMKNSMDKIFKAIAKAGKDPYSIKRIILTHAHSDHSGSAAAIKEKLGIPVFAHAIDAPLIEQGIAGREPMHLTPGVINWLVYRLVIKNADKTIAPVHIDERLNDNDILPIAGGLQILHTPGHSAGHIALLVKNEGVLIAADLCANAGMLALSTLYEDKNLGIQSIVKVAAHTFDKAVFGHGSLLQTDADKKMRAKFMPLMQ